MVAVWTVLAVITVSLLVVRISTVALSLTGVSNDLAEFQALSAFTGSGFTTRESEEIVSHPVRRRIIMHLMLVGNAGIVVAIASVLRLVLETDGGDGWGDSFWLRLLTLSVGVLALWIVAESRAVRSVMWKANAWALTHWTSLEVHDYTRLLHLAGDYAVSEMRVQATDWVAKRALGDLLLAHEGILVLGIESHAGGYIGTPNGKTRIHAGDRLVLYGRQEMLLRLDERRAGFEGNVDHMIAVTKQQDIDEAGSN
jgi:hypothetical protein